MMIRFIFVSLIIGVSGSDYYVNIEDDGPVVVGANITFVANLLKGGARAEGTYKFKWKDNAVPQHRGEFTVNNAQCNWTVSSSAKGFEPKTYEVEVEVFSSILIIDWSLCTKRKSFELTSFLNGEMTLKQNGTSSASDYISNATEVKHQITLHQPDAYFIAGSNVTTYWYLDCNYIGKTNEMTLAYNYTTSDVVHFIDAMVIASHNSSSNLTDDISQNSSSNTESSTDLYLINSTKSTNVKSNNIAFSYLTTATDKGYASNSTGPPLHFDCENKTFAPLDKRNTYGLFSRKVKVKAPVSNLKIEGNNWLQHGDLLNLEVWCNGSAPFSYCVQFHIGNYSIKGNESCSTKITYLSTCNFQIPRYFGNSTNYTVVIIVENDVQKVVRGVNVNVYEVTKHAQLSVIVVPIAAGIVAIILIIFGIAYYVQSRHRYIVEVADFDFSNASDMEYKTFRERLVEAVSNAFNKTEDYSEQDSTNGVPASKKYGSMQ